VKIGVSIVSHGRLEELSETLRCINNLSPKADRVCVVDNASADQELLQSVQRDFPKIHWRCLSKNLGYGAGHHLALRWLMAEGCEAFLLLNPDLRFPADTLLHLQQASEEAENQWILGPLLVQNDSEDPLLDSAGLTLDACFRARDRGQGKRYSQCAFLKNIHKEIQPVWGLCGAALWIPRDLLPLQASRLLFAADYFAYFEDVELALFAQKHGIQMGLLPKLRFLHHRGGFGRLSQLGLKDWQQKPHAVRGALLNRLRAWRSYSSSWAAYPGFWLYELLRGCYLFFRKPFLRSLLKEALEILTSKSNLQ